MVVGQPFDTVKVSLPSRVYILTRNTNRYPALSLWRVTIHATLTYRPGFRQTGWKGRECTEEHTIAFHILWRMKE